MDWSKGYSATWRVFEVNPSTWADGALVGGITSASIERDITGDSPLVESGSIRLDRPVGEGFRERYLRLVMDATQGGSASERVEVATLLCSTAAGTISRGFDELELTGRSVLYPASVRVMDLGSYAPRGVDGVAWSAERLAETIAAPVEATGSFILDDAIVFPVGATYLEAVWSVLRAGGHVITIDGGGSVRIEQKPSGGSIPLDTVGASLLHPTLKPSMDWSDVPNRYMAIRDGETAVAVNDDPTSPTSTVSRGYVHDVLDTSPKLVDGETLVSYCQRRLEEESTIPEGWVYSREYHPDIHPSSLVRGSSASIGFDGLLRVETQSLDCGMGIVVTEKASREVSAWLRG